MSVSAKVQIVALGGLGEVGMNCLALEHSGRILIVDCGTSFPADDYGVDVIHPDFAWLRQNWERIDGVFLTHGHEDHIGGLPHLLANGALPIWGPPHALALVKRRFDEHGGALRDSVMHPVLPGQRTSVGSFVVEPIRVSHSIVEATALAVYTPAGTVVHSGDFKFDPAPSDGEPTDERRLAELGKEGVALLLSDSTNVYSSGVSGSEAEVEIALDEIIKSAQRRVFVALFASNVQRLISLGKIAQRRGRRLCLLGRSMNVHVEVARELGYLDWPRDLVLSPERARTYPKGELLVLASGTQGEPAAALARLAQGAHRAIDVDPGDAVILSSRVIPGCERSVSNMLGALLRRGAVVHSSWTHRVHTSGHANRDEQRRLIELLAPRAFVPLHGTRHHLQCHAELAKQCGVANTWVIENGQSVVLEDGQVRMGEPVPAGKIFVGLGGKALPEPILERRRDLGRLGVISVGFIRDRRGRLCGAPRVQALGLPGLDRQDVQDELTAQLSHSWRGLLREGEAGSANGAPSGRGPHSSERPAWPSARFLSIQQEPLAAQIERFVQRWADEHFGLRPLVMVHVMDAPDSQ